MTPVTAHVSLSAHERNMASVGISSPLSRFASFNDNSFLTSSQLAALKLGQVASTCLSISMLRCVTTGMWSDLARHSSGHVLHSIMSLISELDVKTLSGLM